MSRRSSSRQSSFSYAERSSRRSSVASNPNVFSDDYALEPLDSTLDLTLHDSIQSDHLFVGDHDRTPQQPTIIPYPAIPSRLSVLSRPSSITKRSLGNEVTSPYRDATPSRTISTSSRVSFVRSQSPYSGPTQPSHPYAMYPQVTRASSIASESTIRPPENPFVPTGGPEHPYSLYPQNTVPEDGDEDIGTQPIPLGFPRLGFNHAGTAEGSGSDVGDIIGSDGHVEQLPPYTRYADNIIAKGDMANINDTSTLAPSRRASQRSTLVPTETPSSQHTEANEREHGEREILLSEEPKKETWRDKAHKKICGGVSLWVFIFLVIAIVFAGVVGGVIGGVVGRRQGTDLLESATTTVYLDAEPANTGKNTPPCPTGRYSIPLNQTQNINDCVLPPVPGTSWDCLDIAYLGITISEIPDSGHKGLEVTFDDYSVDVSSFRYGPQPPDFNGTAFPLEPAKDKDNVDLGVAMFFYQEFDKLIILPDGQLGRGPGYKRSSVAERYVRQRGQQFNGEPISIGDEPWFCFWNSTINEFWIFLEKQSTPTSLYTGPMPTPMPTYPSSSTSYAAEAVTTTHTSTTGGWSGVQITPSPTLHARNAYTSPYLPQYPQLVKMIEKRQPENNVPPYCQHMKVHEDWQIVPKSEEVILIQEVQYDITPMSDGSGDAKLMRRGDADDSITEQLESNCVCEWISI